jgi:anti-sigma regulatory factor (Ser/Thr protein kinase)
MLATPLDIRTVRKSVRRACSTVGFSDEREMSFISAVGEAAMNALQHSGAGDVTVTTDSARGVIQVKVVDQGSGISLSNLPRAALERGYSTGGTLGYGLWMILNMADHVWLLTDSTGTTIVLEHDLHEPEIKWFNG